MSDALPPPTAVGDESELRQPQLDDEWLVAYLDGELSGTERRTLEQRLIDEESLRERLQSLQRGWDLLDYLPQPTTDEKLVQTTLEFVVADLVGGKSAAENARTHRGGETDGTATDRSEASSLSSRHRRRWWVKLATVFLVAGLVTALAAYALRAGRVSREFAELPIAVDMDAYAVGDDLELIRALAANPSWQRILPDSAAEQLESLVDPLSADALYVATDAPTTGVPFRPSVSVDELSDALEQLEPQQRAIASSRWDRYQSLDRRTRDQLRQVAANVHRQPDAEELLATMRLYARWSQQLPPDLLDQIESGTPQERTAAIEQGIQDSLFQIAKLTAENLSDEAIERIDYTLEQIVRRRLRDKEPRTQAYYHYLTESLRGGLSERFALRAVVGAMVFDDTESRFSRRLLPRIGRFGPGPRGDRPRGDGRGHPPPPPSPPPPLQEQEITMIESMLPDREAEELAAFPNDSWIRAIILGEFAEETLRRKFSGNGERKSVQDRYQELEPQQRAVLDLLPPEEARERLAERDGRGRFKPRSPE